MADNQQRTTIQDAIKTAIEAVSGTANVFGDALGVVRATNPADYIDNYVDVANDRVHVWFIGRIRTPTDSSETARGQVPLRSVLRRKHTFEIDFFYGYKSATTEAEFQNIIDDVISGFNNSRSLGGWQATPIQLVSSNSHDYLGEVLCHHARFSIEVIEWVDGLSPS